VSIVAKLARNVTEQKLDLLQFARRRSKAVHRFCGDHAAITCRFQPSWHTSEPRSVSLSPQVFAILCTGRNNLPDVMFAA
jgi:hypothetical protein